MYLFSIEIGNIRSLKNMDWHLALEDVAGWHVILGDNGSGKSSFIRSVALALAGPAESLALRQNWNDWLRKDEQKGHIFIGLESDARYDLASSKGRVPKHGVQMAGLDFAREDGNALPPVKARFPKNAIPFNPDRTIWGGRGGWFSASYGPFRRFSGGDKDYEKMFYSNPRLAPHLTAFGESIALTETIQWLQDLQFKKLEKNAEGGLLDQVVHFVNQEGFLPHHARLESVSSDGVIFRDGSGCEIAIDELSDGYRSILSMTLELIRQMFKAYPGKAIFSDDFNQIIVPGVVLIDEVDAHLHPSWQRQIGLWFREHFPNIQFIVTTHSPFVCQAADVGTVYRLPKPGSNEKAGMVTGTDLDRLLFGNILDAYSTDMFGPGATRSEEAKKRQQRLAELNMAELMRDLSAPERAEMESLRSALPTAAHSLPVGANGAK